MKSNVRPFFPYQQYTNLFIFWFVSQHCLRSTLRLLHNVSLEHSLMDCNWSEREGHIVLIVAFVLLKFTSRQSNSFSVLMGFDYRPRVKHRCTCIALHTRSPNGAISWAWIPIWHPFFVLFVFSTSHTIYVYAPTSLDCINSFLTALLPVIFLWFLSCGRRQLWGNLTPD